MRVHTMRMYALHFPLCGQIRFKLGVHILRLAGTCMGYFTFMRALEGNIIRVCTTRMSCVRLQFLA
jgi:hypothetical protein